MINHSILFNFIIRQKINNSFQLEIQNFFRYWPALAVLLEMFIADCFAGPVFVLAGLVDVLAAFLPAPFNLVTGVGAIIGAAALSALYSYVAYRRLQGQV